jgi:signal transduction histidine kinase
MDLLIALSQGLGLAVAAGFVGAPPVAIGATAASADLADSSASVADESWLLIVAWAAAAVELVADAVWPGAQAGVRLARKAAGGGLAFGLVAWDELPWVSIVLGALIAAAVAVALRHVRAGAVKAGGDLRGTALIEDVSGFVAAVVALIPVVGYVMLAAAGALVARARQREQEKYKGLRVLR